MSFSLFSYTYRVISVLQVIPLVFDTDQTGIIKKRYFGEISLSLDYRVCETTISTDLALQNHHPLAARSRKACLDDIGQTVLSVSRNSFLLVTVIVVK